MKKIGIALLIMISIFALSACRGEMKKESGSVQPKADAKKAVAFNLKDINGKEYNLEQYKGKKLVIEFWASWCHICERNLPNMEKLAQKKDKGYELVTVIAPNFQGEKSIEDFKKWLYERGEFTTLPILIDEGGKMTTAYEVSAYPTNIIVDSDGNIAHVIPGAVSEDNLKKILNDVK